MFQKHKLMTLCALAVTAATVAGCATTGGGSAKTNQSASTGSGNTANNSSTSTAPSANQTAQTSTARNKPIKQKYKDGTYTGVGQTPIGAVQVSVTLQSDKFTAVKITGYSTHYSISYIDPILPNELLQRQNINKIDVISGATLSTADFYYAVQDCLQQAAQAQKNG